MHYKNDRCLCGTKILSLRKKIKLTGKNHGKNDKNMVKSWIITFFVNYNRYQTDQVNQVATAYSLASHWRKSPVKAFLFLLARIVSLICLSNSLNKVTGEEETLFFNLLELNAQVLLPLNAQITWEYAGSFFASLRVHEHFIQSVVPFKPYGI